MGSSFAGIFWTRSQNKRRSDPPGSVGGLGTAAEAIFGLGGHHSDPNMNWGMYFIMDSRASERALALTFTKRANLVPVAFPCYALKD